MILFRSVAFKILFPVWLALVCFFYAPFLIFRVPPHVAAKSGVGWASGVVALLRLVCNINYEVRGAENLPEGPFILACKHQSVWDTAIFLKILNHPAYVLKKELLNVPMFGRYLIAIDMIPIDRSAGTSALKGLLVEVKKRIKDGRPVVIFPEGTRVDVGQKIKYQPGVAFLYKDTEIDVPVIPAALNSGHFWNKSLIKKPGTIVLEYLPAIEKGLDRKEFVQVLEERIETAYAKLAAEAAAE